jgi:hypothetical protein
VATTTADVVDPALSVSDPTAPGYNPQSPFYDVTADSSSKYYVGSPGTEAKSGDQIRAEVTAEVDKEQASHTGWLAKLVDSLTRDQQIQKLYEERISQQRQELTDGLTLRSPGSPPSTVWSNASHEQMSTAITQNANSQTVAQASEEWVLVGNELTDHQRDLADAISASSSNWQGSGGDAARQHLANVGQWLGTTAQGATLTGRQQEIHSQTLNETQKRMAANPPVAFSAPDANARLQQITDPIQYARQAQLEMQTFKAQQAARDQAARVMTEFDNTVGSAVATPEFKAPPTLPGTRAAGATSAGDLLPGRGPAGGDLPGGEAAGRVPAGGGLPDGGAPGALGGPGGGSNSGTAAPNAGGTPLDFTGGPGGGSNSRAGTPNAGGTPLDFTGGPGGGSNSGTAAPNGGSGIPGGVPHFTDSTSAAGFTPPQSPGSGPGLNIPTLPGGSFNSGSSYSGVGSGSLPPVPGGSPADFGSSFGGGAGTGANFGGGTGGGAGRIPTIGRSGGVNGESIGSRLMGGPGPIGKGGIKGSGGLGVGGPGGGASTGGKGTGSVGGLGVGGPGGGASTGGRGMGSAGGPGSDIAARSGSGAAAAEAEGTAGRSAAAGVPGAGRGTTSPGMGGMGGRGGKSEEDKEHRLADYLEPDDPSIFAAEEVVAPPVIGDWKNKDWK